MASRAQRPARRRPVLSFDAAEIAKLQHALAAYLTEAGQPDERAEWDTPPGCEAFVNWVAEHGPPRRGPTKRRPRLLSDAGRARIAAAQRRRWARSRQSGPTEAVAA